MGFMGLRGGGFRQGVAGIEKAFQQELFYLVVDLPAGF
jgi:hypothetical protein